MKSIVSLFVLWLAQVCICTATQPSAFVSVVGAIRSPQSIVVEKPVPLDQVLAACGGIVTHGWTRTIIITKQESAVLTSSRKYELGSILGDSVEKTLKEIIVSPGEVVFVQERFE